MKNKIFLSLALLIAANAFIATPAMAYDWKKAANVAFKGAVGATALGTSAIAPFVYGSVLTELSVGFPLRNKLSVLPAALLAVATPQLVGITAFVLTMSVASGYFGFKALQSAWDDLKEY